MLGFYPFGKKEVERYKTISGTFARRASGVNQHPMISMDLEQTSFLSILERKPGVLQFLNIVLAAHHDIVVQIPIISSRETQILALLFGLIVVMVSRSSIGQRR